MDVLRKINTRITPQHQKATTKQVANSAGGYVFALDDVARLRRFLILGVDGGTYYTSAHALAVDNVKVLERLASEDPRTLVDTIVQVSTSGAAPRQNPALFALAYATSVPQSRDAALGALPQVARTGSHLFTFARYVEQFRGWGRGLRRAVGSWYTGRDADSLAYQAVKYRQREGWSHRDLLRLAHPRTDDASLRATFDWITHAGLGETTPALIEGFIKAQQATDAAAWARIVRDYCLTWEMLPAAALTQPVVWEALLDVGVPMTALMRQLPRLTRLGLLPAIGGRTQEVCAQLTDARRLRAARVHPISVLVAQRTYASGTSYRGTTEWTPTTKVTDALDAAFYAAFGAVEPSGRRTMLALDVSGSMDWSVSGMGITAREASAALALVQLATEPEAVAYGFSDAGTASSWRNPALTPLDISPRRRLDDALAVVDAIPMGGTDCALPMLYAIKQKLEVETFVVYTDNETWAGKVHPYQALRRYRERSGIDARLIVVGMTSTGFSIADPDDPGMLDVVGFDAAVPNLISEFARGL
ncbi:TROVE domain-containing protein [Actinomyces sp. oral taxon 897]|uniref:TROVE domain-containing protein n=1 Tax=Actinomyces sp. oral taxon 897 TaxID=2081702 RepID=UPI000D04589B|nr:TROVE domain-containing protein [Actinomyces sp. oral taxon 897]AVM60890.1 TROVE domain-containing protein [Actinomyces sp. oral taxon 897]